MAWQSMVCTNRFPFGLFSVSRTVSPSRMRSHRTRDLPTERQEPESRPWRDLRNPFMDDEFQIVVLAVGTVDGRRDLGWIGD